MIKNKFFILSFLIIFSLTSYSQTFKEYNFKFTIQNKSEIEALTRIISIDKVVNNTVYAFATDRNFEKFKSLNYKYTLLPKSQKDSVKVNIKSKDLIPGNYISNIIVNENDDNQTIIPIQLYVESAQSSASLNPAINIIKIYPNPFSDNITIDFFAQTTTPVYIAIINTNGIIVLQRETKTFSNSKNQIHLENSDNLPAGIYFIQLRINGIQITSRIVKQ